MYASLVGVINQTEYVVSSLAYLKFQDKGLWQYFLTGCFVDTKMQAD